MCMRGGQGSITAATVIRPVVVVLHLVQVQSTAPAAATGLVAVAPRGGSARRAMASAHSTSTTSETTVAASVGARGPEGGCGRSILLRGDAVADNLQWGQGVIGGWGAPSGVTAARGYAAVLRGVRHYLTVVIGGEVASRIYNKTQCQLCITRMFHIRKPVK